MCIEDGRLKAEASSEEGIKYFFIVFHRRIPQQIFIISQFSFAIPPISPALLSFMIISKTSPKYKQINSEQRGRKKRMAEYLLNFYIGASDDE